MTRCAMFTCVLLAVPGLAAAQTPPPPTPPPGEQGPPPATRTAAPLGVWSLPADESGWVGARLLTAYGAGWDQSTFVTGLLGDDYSAGLSLLQRRQYEAAIERFARTIADADDHADGALYWKAFAEYKLGQVDEAAASLEQLRLEFVDSRYLNDARVLEADVQRLAGDPVDPSAIAAMDDDEIKLLAITGIQRSDPEGAIPLLEGVLSASNSLAVKKRTLYVMALSDQPRAYRILLDYAKGAGNPDLQLEAIRYVATNADDESTGADLREIYQSTQDPVIRRAVIDAYRPAWMSFVGNLGGQNNLFHVSADGRLTAPRRAPADLLRLFELEENPDLRGQMVLVFEGLRAVDQLHEVLRIERHPGVRVRAVRGLAGQDSEQAGVTLVNLYGDEGSPEVRRAVIRALGTQQNAEGLVRIARTERDLALRTEIVRRLSELAGESKVAADYLREIIRR